MTPEEAYDKTIELGKRIPELETLISQDARYSYWHAKHVIKGEFILAEPTISKDAYCSYRYARDIIKGRWELGEAAISQDSYISYLYSFYVIKGRWEKGEPTISKDFYSSCYYAKYVIEGRLPDFMHNQMILNNNEYTKEYIEYISKNPDSPNNKI